MAYFLFIDESGHDRKASPYEVLAGVAIQDHDLWNLINALHDAELKHFGRRYSLGTKELKGSNILDKGTFRQSEFNASIRNDEIPTLAKALLDDGANGDIKQIKALALAKLAYVQELFNICSRFRCKAFASIVEKTAQGTNSGGLRKDYAYLFERFFYFLEDIKRDEQGIIVFDELEAT
ncbi:MAG: DUF3800 domain-containing protein [Rickettsiales bacterium]|nr:DUF3800 domain-containing protein [Rickettsiales bacterium]